MAKKYRRRKGPQYDTWHFCQNCHLWPKEPGTYIERDKKPNEELCDHCRRKEENKDCDYLS